METITKGELEMAIKNLKEKGYSNTKISETIGISESLVRALLKNIDSSFEKAH